MKITCDIIKDLLPSYLDDICSKDSRRLIEEHIHVCAKCSQKLKYMKNPIDCPEILTKKELTNPFKKIRKRHHIQLIAAVLITVCILSGGIFAVQEIGPLHDYFYPLNSAVIENQINRKDWSQLRIADEKFLNFDSVFYNKEIVNDANSSGSVTIRILDENRNIVLEETTVEAGQSVSLDMLKDNRNYIVETKCEKGIFFLNFL